MYAQAPPLPPGSFGPPFIGKALALRQDPLTFARALYAAHGPVFHFGMMGQHTVGLVGEAAQQYVLTHIDQFPHGTGAYRFAHTLMRDGMLWIDDAQWSRARKGMTPAFHGRNMVEYLARISRIIDARLATWGDSGMRPLYTETQGVAFRLAMSVLMGVDDPQQIQQVAHDWKVMTDNGLFPIQLAIPGTPWASALAARARINHMMQAVMAERKVAPGSDVLSLLYQTGAFSDEDLEDQFRLLVFAGFDTTTSTFSWLMAELLQRPDLLARVRAECPTTAPLTYDQLRIMPFVDACITETLRLHPQVNFLPRGVATDWDFLGHYIPAGWGIMLFPVLTHRLSAYFADPETFDPDRFMPERDERKAHPYAWIGFSQGPRICIGESVARMEIKAMLAALLGRYPTLALAPNQDLSTNYIPLNRPTGDVLITYAV